MIVHPQPLSPNALPYCLYLRAIPNNLKLTQFRVRLSFQIARNKNKIMVCCDFSKLYIFTCFKDSNSIRKSEIALSLFLIDFFIFKFF